MGVVEALAHPSHPARRLLDMAKTWPDGLPGEVPPKAMYRTARQLRPQEVDELVAAFHAGSTVGQLAGQFDIHRSTVGQHLGARGVDTRATLLQPDDVSAAGRSYKEGRTVVQLAELYDVGEETMRRYLLLSGVTLRPRGRRRHIVG